MVNLDAILAGFATVGMRVSGLLIFAPFIGSLTVPPRVKAGLAFALTALLAPAAIRGRVVAGPQDAVVMLGSEFVIGALMGLAVSFIFDAVQFAGQIMGVQMGYSLVSVLDPQTQVDTPVFALFQQTIAMLIFIRLDVHHWILRSVARSFEYLPAGTSLSNGEVAEVLLRSANAIWVAGIQIAAPALAATILADVALAFVGKASPQLPVLFIGLSIKSVLGMAMVITALAMWPGLFERYFAAAVENGERLLHLVG